MEIQFQKEIEQMRMETQKAIQEKEQVLIEKKEMEFELKRKKNLLEKEIELFDNFNRKKNFLDDKKIVDVAEQGYVERGLVKEDAQWRKKHLPSESKFVKDFDNNSNLIFQKENNNQSNFTQNNNYLKEHDQNNQFKNEYKVQNNDFQQLMTFNKENNYSHQHKNNFAMNTFSNLNKPQDSIYHKRGPRQSSSSYSLNNFHQRYNDTNIFQRNGQLINEKEFGITKHELKDDNLEQLLAKYSNQL